MLHRRVVNNQITKLITPTTITEKAEDHKRLPGQVVIDSYIILFASTFKSSVVGDKGIEPIAPRYERGELSEINFTTVTLIPKSQEAESNCCS